MIPKENIDYVILYAKKLKVDNSYFYQQKKLIEGQFKASKQIFMNKFGSGQEFKDNARAYLKLLEKAMHKSYK